MEDFSGFLWEEHLAKPQISQQQASSQPDNNAAKPTKLYGRQKLPRKEGNHMDNILAMSAIVCGVAAMVCGTISLIRNQSVKDWVSSKKRKKTSSGPDATKDNTNER